MTSQQQLEVVTWGQSMLRLSPPQGASLENAPNERSAVDSRRCPRICSDTSMVRHARSCWFGVPRMAISLNMWLGTQQSLREVLAGMIVPPLFGHLQVDSRQKQGITIMKFNDQAAVEPWVKAEKNPAFEI